MRDFTTGWFDTQQSTIQAKCTARVTRSFQEIRIDWAVYMRLKASGNSIPKTTYIDVTVSGNPTKIGEGGDRIKPNTEAWSGTAEHSISGVLTFEDSASGNGVLTFNSTGNFSSPTVFSNKTLNILYGAYDPNKDVDTPMPFHSVFTTEEYLQNHKGLIPRNNLCNNKSKYVFRYTKYKNVNRKL